MAKQITYIQRSPSGAFFIFTIDEDALVRFDAQQKLTKLLKDKGGSIITDYSVNLQLVNGDAAAHRSLDLAGEFVLFSDGLSEEAFKACFTGGEPSTIDNFMARSVYLGEAARLVFNTASLQAVIHKKHSTEVDTIFLPDTWITDLDKALSYRLSDTPVTRLEQVASIAARGTAQDLLATVSWGADDVDDGSLSDDEKREVLAAIQEEHDCNTGITWEVIAIHRDQILERRG